MNRSEALENAILGNFALEPTPCQRRLFAQAARFLTADEDILVVSGYAGTGKTSALAAIIAALATFKVPSVLLAPTGKSAKVLSGFAQRPAQTIHKAIYRQKSVGENGFGEFSLAPNKARNTLFVVDEASFIGISSQEGGVAGFGSGNLLDDLLRFVRSGTDCKLILCGDAAQLPPVGMDVSPALSSEYMDSYGGVTYATLTTVVRQALGSGILSNATALRQDLEAGEFRFTLRGFDDIERIERSEVSDAIASAYEGWGRDESIVLCRSNRMAVRYNLGIRSYVLGNEEPLLRGDRLMIVKNCYQFLDKDSRMGYIANGDTCELLRLRNFEERYGLHFASASLRFTDYDETVQAKVCLDTLQSESASLTREQQNALYNGVNEDYADISSKRKRYEAVREDPYYNALQLKYSYALTCHKAQGGQWSAVFVDFPFWGRDTLSPDDLKWLYTAITRATGKLFLVGFPDNFFNE